MPRLSQLLASSALCVLGAATLSAQTIVATPGTTFNATAISDNAFGSSMQGMWVDAWFSGNQFFSTQWAILGGDYGINNAGLRIEVGASENTHPITGGDWRIVLNSTADLQRLRFRGASGSTVFDRSTGICLLSPEGTPGSSCGSNAAVLFSSGIVATYTNQVSLNGVVYGDLFETVDLDFSNASRLFNSTFNNRNNSPFNLYMDSDIARNLTTTVPEPSTYALMAAGLLGIFGAARRRRQA